MIVVMKAGASKAELEAVLSEIKARGYRSHLMEGVERNVIGCLGDERGKAVLQTIETLDGVEKVVPILSPYKLAAIQLQKEPSQIKVGENCVFGGSNIPVIAGPCSVESEKQIIETAIAVKKAGANGLRGGAFKPRSSTYSFQGMGEEGLKLLAKAREETGLPVVTEVMDQHMVGLVAEYADLIQIGARNMQNFALLKALGDVGKPILLKRGMSATVDELLMSAEYILAAGNPDVILCERGIRTFETSTRNTLDLNIVPVLRTRTHLPVVVDPSHGTGYWNYVGAMTKAGMAAGADGIILEVHPNPAEAESDGGQSLKFDVFEDLMKELRPLAGALGKTVGLEV